MPSRRVFRRCSSARRCARRARALAARVRQRRRRATAGRRRAAALDGIVVAGRACGAPALHRRARRRRSRPASCSSWGRTTATCRAVVADAAAERGLALVVLHREVKFVTLTEAVHSRIIAGQTDALRARDEVRERFTALVLRGSPADFIVHQLAQTLGAPVILENLGARGGRGRGAAGARGGAAARLGTALAIGAPPRRAASRALAERGCRRMARRARRGARHPLGKPHRAARPRRMPRAGPRCSSRGRSRWRWVDSPTATPTSGAGSDADGCSTGCSPAGSPVPAARLRGSRRRGCR